MASIVQTHHFDSYPSLTETLKKVDLSGKSILITGGGHGIGTSMARRFAESKASKIILVGRTESRLVATIKELSSLGTTFTYHVADVTSSEDVQSLFAKLDFSPDVLINNAGYLATPGSFLEADLDDYFNSFKVNIFGTALVTQAYLKHRSQFQTGPALVLTVNTIGAFTVRSPGLSSYAASKAGLARMTELIAEDVPETTARFISVHPGAVASDMLTKSGLHDNEHIPKTKASLVGDFMVWLTTEEANFLTSRFVWVNWDVEEILQAKAEILEKDLFRSALSGA